MQSAEEILLKAKHSREQQCGYCGSYNQKVCWECYQSDIDEIRERTRKIELFLRSKFLEEWDSFEEA